MDEEEEDDDDDVIIERPSALGGTDTDPERLSTGGPISQPNAAVLQSSSSNPK
jgi:hypothetical protein